MRPAEPPPDRPPEPPRVDAIAIGRNEGARLRACLASLRGQVGRVVYVDSGSTDGSVAAARSAGADVVELDMSIPFTAARARNAGLAHLASLPDAAPFVQMIDGDCALREGWVAAGLAALRADPTAALVFGRRREREPSASLFNRLCDWEWDVPVGPVSACGGDFLARRAALEQAGGYRDDVIAAEDDEMCQRLRALGWTLHRIPAEMTWHDAAMHRFGQWWRRTMRAGHGFAQVGALHPGHFRPQRMRALIWGAALPLAAVLAVPVMPWVTLAIAGLYLLSTARMARRFRARGEAAPQSWGMAALVTLSKLPNAQGMAVWALRRLRGDGARIIEYK
jgi:GT2 family glycosyltransferase